MTSRRSNSTWGKVELESSLPHIIVDEHGKRVRPLPQFPPFKTRGQATRVLNRLKAGNNPLLLGNPKLWSVQPVRDE